MDRPVFKGHLIFKVLRYLCFRVCLPLHVTYIHIPDLRPVIRRKMDIYLLPDNGYLFVFQVCLHPSFSICPGGHCKFSPAKLMLDNFVTTW